MKPTLFFIFLWISVSVSAQTPNWQNKDLQKDSVFGISTDRAYSSLLKHKRAKTVLVAVIDGGVDTAHEDLKAVILSLIHISEPTRQAEISYAVFCLKKK